MLLDSGICSIYAVDEDGERIEPEKSRHMFGLLTVGVSRNYAARQNNEQIDLLVRIWRDLGIRTTDLCTIEGETYYIRQVQHRSDEDGLYVTDLALERKLCDVS